MYCKHIHISKFSKFFLYDCVLQEQKLRKEKLSTQQITADATCYFLPSALVLQFVELGDKYEDSTELSASMSMEQNDLFGFLFHTKCCNVSNFSVTITNN